MDESDATSKMLAYLGCVLAARAAGRDVVVCLGYILPTMPARLLEFGGDEDPRTERRLTKSLRQGQSQWTTDAEAASDRCFAKAQSELVRAGVPASAIETCLTSPLDQRSPADEVLILAREQQCGTIAIGRHSHGWFEGGRDHLAVHLVRDAEGLAIWVVT